MKTLYFTVLALILPFSTLFAQQELIGGQAIGGNRVNLLIDVTPKVANEYVEGSPYINEEFLPASISASEDNIFYVRYNAMTDEFEVKGENKAYALNRYRRDIVIDILPLKKKYQVQGYLDDNNNENFGYFLYLTNENSNHILFKKEKVVFLDEVEAKTSYDSSKPARFKRLNDAFYIKLADDKLLTELPKNKKSIAKLFPEHEEDIIKYIKKQRIKTSKEDDLIQLVNYINAINTN